MNFAFPSDATSVAHHVSIKGVKVSVIVPTKSEAANLPIVLPRIPGWVHELILVDGNSADGTVEVAKRLRPDVIVVPQDRPGKGAALRCGFAAARGDIVVTLDADGSADPGEMPLFVGALLAGHDVAKGTRFAQGGTSEDITVIRRLGNWFLELVAKLLFGGHFTDLCYGYNAFWRDKLAVLDLEGADGFEIEAVMQVEALKAGLNICEVPSVELPRISGHSKLHAVRDGFRILGAMIAHRMRKRRNARTGRTGNPS
ncbi:MAG: glycosyltransferase family 2 protein [Alphaproteobacteria bacterium]|nr:glycosyltransferase family 2 protein [Alphaproteobacteria bacterium]